MASVSVTIASGTVSSTLTDFPLIIDLSRLTTNFKAALNGTAGNLRAYSGATQLYVDIIGWDGTNGFAAIKIPSVASGADTVIALRISGSTQPAVGATGGRNGVWSDYEFALFGESTSFTDHAGKQTFTVSGTSADITSGTETSALFAGNSLRFSTGGSSSGGDGIYCSLSADLRSFTCSFTGITTFRNLADNFAFCSLYNNASNGLRKTMAQRGTDGTGSCECWDSTNSWFTPSPTFAPTLNTQAFRATLTYSANSSGTRRQLYNGPGGSVTSGSYSSHPVGDRYILGLNQPGGSEPGNLHAGFAYVRSGVLADAWLTAEYNMLNAPGSFYTIADVLDDVPYAVGVSMAATLDHAPLTLNLPASPALGVTMAASISHIQSRRQPVICVVT